MNPTGDIVTELYLFAHGRRSGARPARASSTGARTPTIAFLLERGGSRGGRPTYGITTAEASRLPARREWWRAPGVLGPERRRLMKGLWLVAGGWLPFGQRSAFCSGCRCSGGRSRPSAPRSCSSAPTRFSMAPGRSRWRSAAPTDGAKTPLASPGPRMWASVCQGHEDRREDEHRGNGVAPLGDQRFPHIIGPGLVHGAYRVVSTVAGSTRHAP